MDQHGLEIRLVTQLTILFHGLFQSQFILHGQVTVTLGKRPHSVFRRDQLVILFLIEAFFRHFRWLLDMDGQRSGIIIHILVKTHPAPPFQHRLLQFHRVREARFVGLERVAVGVRVKQLRLPPQARQRTVGACIRYHELHAPATRPDHREQRLRVSGNLPAQRLRFRLTVQPVYFQQDPSVIFFHHVLTKCSGKQQLRQFLRECITAVRLSAP